MSREKQIDEMAKILRVDDCFTVGINDCRKFNDCNICKATRLYNAGYRKRSEGAWIKDEESKFEHRYHCSVCNFYLIGKPTKYCEDCGAYMKGGAE